MKSRRPALIFDFGNVVAFFDYAIACEKYSRQLNLTPQAFLETLRERGLTPVVQRFERGEMSAQEFTQAVARLAGTAIPHKEFAAAWGDIFTLNQPVADLVASLSALSYPLILGSNTNEIHAAHFRPLFADTFAHFDHLILSYEIKQLKPGAAFYQACAKAADANPSECIFIDDMPENVEGARQAGLQGVHFRGIDILLEDLSMLGVEIDGLKR